MVTKTSISHTYQALYSTDNAAIHRWHANRGVGLHCCGFNPKKNSQWFCFSNWAHNQLHKNYVRAHACTTRHKHDHHKHSTLPCLFFPSNLPRPSPLTYLTSFQCFSPHPWKCRKFLIQWKAKLLSKWDRLVLLAAVIESLEIYLYVFLIPRKVLKNVDAFRRSFFGQLKSLA